MKIKFDIDNDSFWEGLGQPMVFWIVVFFLFFVSALSLTNKFIACPAFGRAVEKPTFYSFWAGDCYVKLTDGTIVAQENYGGVNVENNK
jgi:hypothetical protein